MKLFLKNIGKISKAEIAIDGITVIAGENNTGKSTVGKALFSVFNSFYNIEEQIASERRESIERILYLMYMKMEPRASIQMNLEDISKNLVKNKVYFINNIDLLREEVVNNYLQSNIKFINREKAFEVSAESIERLVAVLKVSDAEIFKIVLEKNLNAEFYGQINNILAKEMGQIELFIQEQKISVVLEDSQIQKLEGNSSLRTDAVYLDDPFLLDEAKSKVWFNNMKNMSHREHLRDKLLLENNSNNIIDEIIVNNKFENIYKKLDKICHGDIVNAKNTGIGYKLENNESVLDVRNLSTGLKTFAILKRLLQNGTLQYNGTIILDEPEIHLHPQWQLQFAELIVLLHKEFNMHILLNTHSPYFLEAIEVYAKKHDVSSGCRYYMTVEEGATSYIEDVSDDLERIYSKLAEPLQVLENVRYRYD